MTVTGDTLRTFRMHTGVSLAQMARQAGYSAPYLSNVESGRRAVLPAIVAAYQRILGDNVQRRAVIGGLIAAAAAGISLSPEVLGEFVRQGLHNRGAGADDWQAIIADLDRRLPLLAPEMEPELVAHLMIVRQGLEEKSQDPVLLRAGASLGLIYGLWLGNCGRVSRARGWWRTATGLADETGDNKLRASVRARVGNRGPYGGYTARETLALADESLALNSDATLSTAEAHGARLHIHALTGDLQSGRQAAIEMMRVAQSLDGDLGARAVARASLFSAFLEMRLGEPAAAPAVFDVTAPLLRSIPPWHTEAGVYLARARVAGGDTSGGISQALALVNGYRTDLHTLRVAVSDVLEAVPVGHRSDELDELARFASPDPLPWHSL